MLAIVRLLLTVGLFYGLVQVARHAEANPQSGDLMNAFWLAYCVIVAFFMAIAWASLVGERIADPVTGVYVRSTFTDRPNWLIRVVQWLEGRRCRRLVRWLCFVEGVRHPWLPTAFVTGLRNSEPGSWLEKVYAREVYQFNNTENCIRAYRILRGRGLPVPPHPNTEVNAVLLSLDREHRPESPVLPVPTSAPPLLKRDRRIRLFGKDEGGAPPPSEADPNPPSSAAPGGLGSDSIEPSPAVEPKPADGGEDPAPGDTDPR